MDLQIFVFTWNTQTVRYNTQNGPKADFIDEIGQKIISSKCDIIILGLQEDEMRNGTLLGKDTSLLVEAIKSNYQLVEQRSLSGWGSTTFKALKNNWSYCPRGLRLAVFQRRDTDIQISQVDTTEIICPGLRNWFTWGKGGIVINLHTNFGQIAFLNLHLPFSSDSLIIDPQNHTKRYDSVMWQAECLRSLYNHTINKFSPDLIFILGDLNFRVQIGPDSGAKEIADRLFSDPTCLSELIKESDELTILLDYSQHTRGFLPLLKEGIDNQGPLFLPTCKMLQGRNSMADDGVDSYLLGHENERAPSWCDRILYKQFNRDYMIKCNLYDRWEIGQMRQSDHSAVIGIYTVNSPEYF